MPSFHVLMMRRFSHCHTSPRTFPSGAHSPAPGNLAQAAARSRRPGPAGLRCATGSAHLGRGEVTELLPTSVSLSQKPPGPTAMFQGWGGSRVSQPGRAGKNCSDSRCHLPASGPNDTEAETLRRLVIQGGPNTCSAFFVVYFNYLFPPRAHAPCKNTASPNQ